MHSQSIARIRSFYMSFIISLSLILGLKYLSSNHTMHTVATDGESNLSFSVN